MTTPNRFLLFVSYSCHDSEHSFLCTLRQFFDRPDVQRVATYFMAEDAPSFGRDFIEKVLDALGKSDAVLPFITVESQLSPWVNQEIGFARARETPVLPAFDPANVERLQGMIQITDACPVDDPVKVQMLFDRLLALATQEPTTRKHGLSIVVTGHWWSRYQGAFPMYLRVELTHKNREPDAIQRAFLECPDRIIELESVDRAKLQELRPADFKDVVLKFFPAAYAQVERMTLVIQTVRGQEANVVFETAGPSGWRPPEMWRGFTPY